MANQVRVRTSTGWQDLVMMGPTGPAGPPGALGPTGPTGATGPAGPAGVLATRTTGTVTTTSLAAGAIANTTIPLATGYTLLHIQLDRGARVRLYGTVAQRTADAARAVGTAPATGTGLVFEYRMLTAVNLDLDWAVDGFSTESTPTRNIPVAITNESGATATVTLTLTYLRTE